MTQHQDSISNELRQLEEIDNAKIRQFVEEEKNKTFDRLKKDPLFPVLEEEALQILTAKDKLPHIFMIQQDVYQFWQDRQHVRGQLQRMSVENYNNKKSNWEVVFDLDDVATKENKNWVWKGVQCLYSNPEKCIVSLSDGGKDAVTIREYNLKDKKFAEQGFFIPESKSHLTWYDENTVFWADALNKNYLTQSGYARKLKILKRGQGLNEAETVLDVPETYTSVFNLVFEDQKKIHFIIGSWVSFELSEYFYVKSLNPFKVEKINIPKDAFIEAVIDNKIIFNIKKDLKTQAKTFKSGSVLSLNIDQMHSLENLEIVFSPNEKQVSMVTSQGKNGLWIEIINDVKKQVKYAVYKKGWQLFDVKANSLNNEAGNLGLLSVSSHTNGVYLIYSDFLTPTQYVYAEPDLKNQISLKSVQQSPARFDSSHLVVHQYKVKSRDGILIPYYIVHSKKIKLDGKNPTLMYGYGGFEIPMLPQYIGVVGKLWLSRGGVYVLTNIRGGYEYGPEWHQAALKGNRQKAYDDFAAIAEDLISRKITSPQHLGIMGGSNGGLLTSVMLTQRPELFSAVISEVPLTNMLQFHKWLAGASWQDEYGNPELESDRQFLLKYSPLHNIKKEIQYPEALYITSTKDDRVHPAHARQMVTRLKQLGHSVLYYENIDGGHGRAANMNEYAFVQALEYTYLFQKLKK